MLLEFRAKNFKSFKDELVFTMEKAPKQTGLDYSVFHKKIAKKKYSVLSSAVIYGSNASGKTNIIGAMDAFKQIVFRGHIRNGKDIKSPNMAAYSLELIPNSRSTEGLLVEFYIKFIEDELLVEYSLSLDLGNFLEKDYQRKIIDEKLIVNDKILYERKHGNVLFLGDLSHVEKYLNPVIIKNRDIGLSLANESIKDDELFLSNGMKVLVSNELPSLIHSWFNNKLIAIYSVDSLVPASTQVGLKTGAIYRDEFLNKALEQFGTINKLGFKRNEESYSYSLVSFVDNSPFPIPAEAYESYGTIQFVKLLSLIKEALEKGSTLVIDEFGTSIHPIALMSIINVFHNDEINVNHAQLIFNTHNPIFLRSDLFRRDEIKFTERDNETGYSTQYSLSDFRTEGAVAVRNGEDYMRNYFYGKYGGISDVDFTAIFDGLMNNSGRGEK